MSDNTIVEKSLYDPTIHVKKAIITFVWKELLGKNVWETRSD